MNRIGQDIPVQDFIAYSAAFGLDKELGMADTLVVLYSKLHWLPIVIHKLSSHIRMK